MYVPSLTNHLAYPHYLLAGGIDTTFVNFAFDRAVPLHAGIVLDHNPLPKELKV